MIEWLGLRRPSPAASRECTWLSRPFLPISAIKGERKSCRVLKDLFLSTDDQIRQCFSPLCIEGFFDGPREKGRKGEGKR